MKKILLLLPAVAVTIAVACAMTSTSPILIIDVTVTASPVYCALDGFCDQSHAATCRLTSTDVVFYRIQGSICATAATGKFHQ